MRYIDWATVLLAGELTAADELVFECDQPVRAFFLTSSERAELHKKVAHLSPPSVVWDEKMEEFMYDDVRTDFFVESIHLVASVFFVLRRERAFSSSM